jgi:hypothetical protein
MKIVLTMIVKNEEAVLERCLASVRSLIHAWCIVDTGSTDQTPALACDVLAGLPGTLHRRPWRDFGYNRSEAIRLARPLGDYHLVIDADDRLAYPEGFTFPVLLDPAYKLQVVDANLVYDRTHLFRTDIDFRYDYVLHEVLAAPATHEPWAYCGTTLRDLKYMRCGGGARSQDPQKYRNDAQVLKEALAKEPHNARYAFYLAQSYRDAGDLGAAREAYERRARMTSWDEETWYALYQVAQLTEAIDPEDEMRVCDAYLRAWEFRSCRAEPLCALAHYLRTRCDRPATAYVFAKIADEVPYPKQDILFLDPSVYDWRAQYERAITSWYVGERDESRELHLRLLKNKNIPEHEKSFLHANLIFFKAM